METWTRMFDAGLPWDSIYTDFSKAFDSVPHQRLLTKIHSYGIRGKLYKWIESFLSNRCQRVVLGDEKSEWKPVKSGIPQGSVLGPILFTIFINDMPEEIKSNIKLFADDTKIFRAVESLEDTEIIQNDINSLLKWSSKWQLPFNIEKCKVLHFGQNNPKHKYDMGQEALATEEVEKDVGVTFDTDFSFNQHIKAMISKANSRVGIIKRTFTKLDIQSFTLLYKSIVRPILEYCSSIWFPLYQKDINEIEKVQRRATKLIPSLSHLTYAERLHILNIPTLSYRRKRCDVLQVFRIIKGIDKIDFDTFFTRNTNSTRGHCWKLLKPRAETRIRLNSFSHRVINIWNSLPTEVVNSTSINSFKNSLEKAWKDDPRKFDPLG
jgi:ribonuclease P/MRP protein subunit RPP40